MSADDALDDESFARRLAELDDDLAAGRLPKAGLPARLRRGVAALQALRRLGTDSHTNFTLPLAGTRPAHHGSNGALPPLIGRFHVVRELGRGGFGVVYLAHDPRLDREVALKVPHATAIVDEQIAERFRREPRAAAGLDHPNIVAVSDELGSQFRLEDCLEIRGNLDGLLGHVRFGQQRWEEADRLLATANAPIADPVPTAPARLMYHTFYVRNCLYRAQALDRLGRSKEATDVLRNAVAIDMPPPNQQFAHPGPDYLECLAILLQRLPEDSGQRVAMAAKATTVLETVTDWPSYAAVRTKLRAALAGR